MSNKIVSTHQRGSTLRCNISYIKYSDVSTETTTDSFNVDDLALAALRLRSNNSTDIEVSVITKNNTTRKCTMHVKCLEISRLISLSEEWTQTILTIKHGEKLQGLNRSPVLLYMIEVNFTVFEESFMPMIVNKQLYEDVQSTDFELHTVDGSVAVHKAVLFIHSDMFRTMFRGEWKETGEGRIKLDGVTAQTLQHLKDYMYLGTLPDEGLELMLLFAARYMMDNLREACITKLVKTMKPENFDEIVEIAAQNNIGDLVRALIMDIPDDVINKVHKLKENTNKINKVHELKKNTNKNDEK